MKKGHYAYVEFYIPDANDEEDAIKKLRQALENQEYSWELTEVEFEEGDEE